VATRGSSRLLVCCLHHVSFTTTHFRYGPYSAAQCVVFSTWALQIFHKPLVGAPNRKLVYSFATLNSVDQLFLFSQLSDGGNLLYPPPCSTKCTQSTKHDAVKDITLTSPVLFQTIHFCDTPGIRVTKKIHDYLPYCTAIIPCTRHIRRYYYFVPTAL
jgi:hypothetical protein